MKKFILYRHFDRVGNLLYVGKTLSLQERISQHKGCSCWFDEIYFITIDRFPNNILLSLAEKGAIEKEKPKFNIYVASKKRKFIYPSNEKLRQIIFDNEKILRKHYSRYQVKNWIEKKKILDSGDKRWILNILKIPYIRYVDKNSNS